MTIRELGRGGMWQSPLWLSKVICAVGLLTTAACQTDNKINIEHPHYDITSKDRAGTVTVSATLVAPWQDVAATLSPSFTMSGTTAATLVLPTTEQMSRQSLEAVSAALGLGVGLPTTSSSSATPAAAATGLSSGSTGATGTASTTAAATTTTTTTTAAPSTTATAGSGASSQPVAAPATSLPTSLPAATAAATLGVDPVLRYKEAAYLNQEVQLLNSEVVEATRQHCYVPYVVKLKVAFLPYVNPLPLSAHTQISFLQGTDERPDPDSYPARATSSAKNASAEAGCRDLGAVPAVVPFLVADDLQLGAYSNSTEVARQLALAVSFMAHGVNGSATANNLYEALTAVQNEAMHSSLTVARTVNNGLYVLIAPNNEATGSATLVGQTYDVAVLLLIPRSYFGAIRSQCHCEDKPQPAQISIESYTQLRNVKDGRVLANYLDEAHSANDIRYSQDDNNKPSDYWNIISSYTSPAITYSFRRLPLGIQRKFFTQFFAGIQGGNYQEYIQSIERCPFNSDNINRKYADLAPYCPPIGFAASLWAPLTALTINSPFNTADFEAPLPQDIIVPGQQVPVVDDKSGTVNVVLTGVTGSSGSALAAELDLTPSVTTVITDKPDKSDPSAPASKGKAPSPKPVLPPVATPGAPLRFAAQSITLDPVAHTLTLTFPSPVNAGVAAAFTPTDPTKPNPNMLKIGSVACDDTSSLCPGVTVGALPVSFETKPTPQDLGFTLVNTGGVIYFDNKGVATLPVMVNSIKNVTVALNVSGAAVTGVTGPFSSTTASGPVNLSTDGYEVTAPGLYNFTLEGVFAGETVTVTAAGSVPAPATTGAPSGQKPKGASTGSATESFVAIPQLTPPKGT